MSGTLHRLTGPKLVAAAAERLMRAGCKRLVVRDHAKGAEGVVVCEDGLIRCRSGRDQLTVLQALERQVRARPAGVLVEGPWAR